MKSASEILSNLYTCPEIARVMLKIPAAHRDDVRQEAFFVLCKMPEEKLKDLYTRGKLNSYFLRTLYITAHMPKSDYNRQQRRREQPTEKMDDVPDDQRWRTDEELLRAVTIRLDAIYWYNRDMIRLYVKHGNLRAVAAATGIPVSSVRAAINKGRQEILRELKEYL